MRLSPLYILGDPGTDSGGEGKSKRAEKYGTKKTKERREEPLGTMSYQTSSKRSPPFWLLIGARKNKFSGTNQKSERRRPWVSEDVSCTILDKRGALPNYISFFLPAPEDNKRKDC